MISLAQDRALVTGASAGLGLGIASELAARNARVLMASREERSIQAAAERTDRHWEDAFRLILLAPIRLIRACLPMLRESDHGRIVLISSISGLRPVERLMLSNVLRPSLMGLARHLANELAPDGILINAIAPGFFGTERAREVQEAIAQTSGRSLDEVQADLTAGIPLGREGDPAELGRFVAFLTSAENTYITGQTLVMDGGMLGSW
jgi:3-oxoacyl-[acyl-carrier protein] reductase